MIFYYFLEEIKLIGKYTVDFSHNCRFEPKVW